MFESRTTGTVTATPQRCRLDETPTGTRGIVQQIAATDAALSRLMAMGLCVGREVSVVQQGNPLIVRVLGARVGLSGRVAQQILVDTLAH